MPDTLSRASFRLEGGERFAKNLAALPDAVRRATLEKILRLAAGPMRARAAEMAPKGSEEIPHRRWQGEGHLRDNIIIGRASRIGSVLGGRWERADEQQAAIAVGPDQDHYWGIFLEYGTVKMPTPRPFMRPAFDGEAPGALATIQDEIWKALRASIVEPSTGGGTL